MTKPIDLFQGSDRIIRVKTRSDLSAATEIEFVINTCPQIVKSLSAGEITGVTSTEYSVTIEPGDTSSVRSGDYGYQSRATFASGVVTHSAEFKPPIVRIVNSFFETVQ